MPGLVDPPGQDDYCMALQIIVDTNRRIVDSLSNRQLCFIPNSGSFSADNLLDMPRNPICSASSIPENFNNLRLTGGLLVYQIQVDVGVGRHSEIKYSDTMIS